MTTIMLIIWMIYMPIGLLLMMLDLKKMSIFELFVWSVVSLYFLVGGVMIPMVLTFVAFILKFVGWADRRDKENGIVYEDDPNRGIFY